MTKETSYNVNALREAVAEMAVEHPTDEDLITWAVESYLQDFSEEELVEKANNYGLDISEYIEEE